MKEDDVQVSMTWPEGVNVGSAKQTLELLTKMENPSGVFKPRVVEILSYGDYSEMTKKLVNAVKFGVTTPTKETRRLHAKKRIFDEDKVRTNNILSDSSLTTLVWEPSCEKSATPEVAAACNKLDDDRATDVIDDEPLDNNSDGVGDVTRNGYTDLDIADSLPPTEHSNLLQVDSGASTSKCSPKNVSKATEAADNVIITSTILNEQVETVNQLSQVKPCGVNNSTEPSHDGETDCIAEVSATPTPPQPASPSGSPRRSSNQPDIEANVFDKINPCGANTSTEPNNESETDCNAEVSPTSTPSPPALPSSSPHMPGNHQNIKVQVTAQTVDDGSRGEAISIDALREELRETREELDSTRKELDNTRKELGMLKSGLFNSIADLENKACSSFTSGIKKCLRTLVYWIDPACDFCPLETVTASTECTLDASQESNSSLVRGGVEKKRKRQSNKTSACPPKKRRKVFPLPTKAELDKRVKAIVDNTNSTTKKIANEALPILFTPEELGRSCLFGPRRRDDAPRSPDERPPLDPERLNASLSKLAELDPMRFEFHVFKKRNFR
ncbi:hypothetical protein QAD02_021927 [Eretmocerus hayati]|uniref:Uncharacterized protein n=1 Tax=Eretmocerus hayati TaxID=131215 RepID=A0ACC2PSP9_9HYME|nr:hypothetical protein QAD02_021927 [Eretmocerus hayati]